jgi:hypothetical protein
MSSNNDITALRAALFETLRGVRDGTVDLDKARAINELSKTLVDTAKVEVDYLRATGGGESAFIETGAGAPQLPSAAPGNGIGGMVHQLQGRTTQ